MQEQTLDYIVGADCVIGFDLKSDQKAFNFLHSELNLIENKLINLTEYLNLRKKTIFGSSIHCLFVFSHHWFSREVHFLKVDARIKMLLFCQYFEIIRKKRNGQEIIKKYKECIMCNKKKEITIR